MEFNQIQDLVKLVSRLKITEFEIREGDFELIIRSQEQSEKVKETQVVIPATQPMMQLQHQGLAPVPQAPVASAAPTPPAASSEPAKESEENSNLIEIKSPMVGTFYRSPSPDKPPFLKVGDTISAGDTVCIIEAMKLFNEIEAEVSGKLVKVLVEDAQPVEYDQPLFLIEAS